MIAHPAYSAPAPDSAGAEAPRSSGALRVDGVSHSFNDRARGDTQVLDHVSFEVGTGEFVSLVGPSGCGKSTVLMMIAGFLAPNEGRISWSDRPINGPDAERGMVFQKPQLYPWLNVLDNVLFGPKALGREKEAQPIARELISEVGLDGFERHRPYELSGGMQHRVALARTLVNRPPLLLMDEPFAALDAQTREEMQALLLEIWQRHRCTVVFVTHDLEESLLLSDRVLIMGHRPGTIKEEVPVRFARPRDDSLVLDPEFVEMRGRIRAIFRKEERDGSANEGQPG